MKLEANGKLKYQIEWKGIGISKIIMCENATEVEGELKKLEYQFENKEKFMEYINKNIIITAYIKLNIIEYEYNKEI